MAIDLTGQFFDIAQGKIEKGQPIDLNFSVLNQGDESVDPFSFDIVISQDGEISEDDYKLGNYKIVNGLDAGADSGLKSYRYSTPAANSKFWSDDISSYTVGIRLDPEFEYFEKDEDNNSNVGLGVDYDKVEVGEFGLSDLKGGYLGVSDTPITPGDKIDVAFAIKNDSTEMASPFSVDVYLSSTEGTTSEDAVKIGTYDIRGNIAGGKTSGEKRFSYSAPELGDPIWENGDGEYYVTFDIDPDNQVTESNEDNNSGLGKGVDYAGINVAGLNDAADLVVTSFTAPENAEAGDTVTVEYAIENKGGTSADLFAAGFYLFGEDYLADNDSLDLDAVPEVFFLQGNKGDSAISLDAGESTGTITTDITLPENWGGYGGDGDYYLGVEADVFDDVTEVSDANNSLTKEGVDYQQVSLNAPVDNTVDLVGTEFDVVQDQIVPGQEFDLAFTVKNEGLAPVEEFSFDLYLSQDADINPDEDVYLGTYDIKDGLNGMENTDIDTEFGIVPRSIRYTAPEMDDAFWSEGDGAYYAGMVIDPENDIAESNEDNNSNVGEGLDYKQTYVTGLGKVADLKTNGFNVVPETINTGDSFEVSYEIFNEGTERADLAGAGFFIFTEDYLNNNDSLEIADVPQVYFLQGDYDDAIFNLDPATGTGIVTSELTMPSDWDGFAMGSGEYYVGVAADPYQEIIESDETNNSLVGEFIDYEKVNINVTSDI